MMTGKMNLKMPTGKNITVDMRVTYSTGTKTGKMKVETGVIKIETDPIPPMKKGSMTLTLEIPTPEVGVPWPLQDLMAIQQPKLYLNTPM